jgi:hypothetical protein
LVDLPAGEMWLVFDELMALVAGRIRLQSLAIVYTITPLSIALGGGDAAREVLDAVMDVCRWWPNYVEVG